MSDIQKKKRSTTCLWTDSAEVRSKSRVTALSETASIDFGFLNSTG